MPANTPADDRAYPSDVAFTPAVKTRFKELYGDLLIQLGYEQDANW